MAGASGQCRARHRSSKRPPGSIPAPCTVKNLLCTSVSGHHFSRELSYVYVQSASGSAPGTPATARPPSSSNSLHATLPHPPQNPLLDSNQMELLMFSARAAMPCVLGTPLWKSHPASPPLSGPPPRHHGHTSPPLRACPPPGLSVAGSALPALGRLPGRDRHV